MKAALQLMWTVGGGSAIIWNFNMTATQRQADEDNVQGRVEIHICREL